jgi:hypothetical protein
VVEPTTRQAIATPRTKKNTKASRIVAKTFVPKSTVRGQGQIAKIVSPSRTTCTSAVNPGKNSDKSDAKERQEALFQPEMAMERTGIEPVTSGLQSRRSPS